MALIRSPKFALISYDWKKWLYNAAIFMIPVAIFFLGELIKIVPQDWQYGALALYALNLIIDILRKWVGSNTYQK